ncbi:hypothetical protein PAPYR_8866 [Paratrimastix pyriformis]|uniref:SHSP domain-containing protein n=1 Tax=Paratrimastix pyriformis TaxID=342808 RepID=A0ABQ8U9Q4_9EUKA|nr:hypothetical protein PAPYR_8866 [Paratrimastix pyriformis]
MRRLAALAASPRTAPRAALAARLPALAARAPTASLLAASPAVARPRAALAARLPASPPPAPPLAALVARLPALAASPSPAPPLAAPAASPRLAPRALAARPPALAASPSPAQPLAAPAASRRTAPRARVASPAATQPRATLAARLPARAASRPAAPFARAHAAPATTVAGEATATPSLDHHEAPSVSEKKEPAAVRWLAPRCDVEENPDEVLLHVELPGVPRESAHLDVDPARGLLTVTAHAPRRGADFRRVVRLPHNCQPCLGEITAACADGVMTIRCPKAAAPQPVSIPIQ